ncbi:putative nucleotide-diphospho-sugar transferase [Prolixibacter sp. NT017]|uniref:putative nucleotide-diphospho-sugar transferase n=1 Tax=Prolixibacter sp. NT017 TaxID=2652390 RepID=UPI00188F4582|nr:putative nucleotide-diphospho-sugar transferase [Prolixibacter sp. NT017]
MNNNISIFTVCNVAYLNKVSVLAKSVFKNTGIKLDIFVFDIKREVNVNSRYCQITWIEELEIPNLKKLAFKYTVIELTTALKPYIALKLLEKNNKVIFFDPDVMVFNSLNSIFDNLDQNPIVITPHYFHPKINGLIDDARLMRFGSFNLGFFAVNNSDYSKEFLTWWSERCLTDGFDDTQFGIFTDQKWVSIAPNFFPQIHITYDPGYNVAFWNIDERTITKNSEGKYIVNKEYPLSFFHFSSFSSEFPEKLTAKNFNLGENAPELISEISVLYSNELRKHNNISSDTTYSFDYMSDGRYISPALRRAYASMMNKLPENHDPFDSKDIIATFAKKNHLFQKNNKRYSANGYKNVGENTWKFKIVYVLMKFTLRIIGPNNFMNLSRLLVYLSSYHKIDEMWKYGNNEK